MRKLYETQSDLTENSTVITSAYEKDGRFFMTLEESIFFPEEGGQYADTGVLMYEESRDSVCAHVIDGQIINGEVLYETDVLVVTDTKVHCVLDAQKRRDRMENHSGEHVLTSVIHNKYGFNNVGFHLSDDDFVTLMMDGVLSPEQVYAMEEEANRIVRRDYPIVDSYPTKEELANISYRSKIEIEGQVRLITIGDENETIDVCACCAPHVKSTGQIGIIKVMNVINYKGGILISILCGRRALEYINRQQALLSSVAGSMSTSWENIPDRFNLLSQENASLRLQLSKASEENAVMAVSAMSDADPHCLFEAGDFPQGAMKNVYNRMVETIPGYVGIFVGDDASGYRYYAGGKGLDARTFGNAMRRFLAAKGGGSEEMIQGKVAATKVEIEKFFLEYQKKG